MIDTKYVVGQDVKILLEDSEDYVPFSFPATEADTQLYADLTMAKRFPANHTPYTDTLSRIADLSEVNAYFLAQEEDLGGVTRQKINNVIQVNDESGPTSPATGIFFGTVTGGSNRWKGDAHAYRDEYNPGEIGEWMELDLDDVEPEPTTISGDTTLHLTGTGYENIESLTIPVLEFEDVRIPNTSEGEELRQLAFESLYQALEDGDYMTGPPPSYVINQVENGRSNVMDIPRVFSAMIGAADEPITGIVRDGRTAYYLGEGEAVEVPEHVALTYVARNGGELDATDEFVEFHSTEIEPFTTELEPEEDPMIF